VKLLDMSCSQALILLAFNDVPRLTCTKLGEITGLTEAELKRQLVSLTIAEHPVLVILDSHQEEAKDSKSLKQAGGVIKRQINSKD
jgi:hypothetical protein